MNKQEFMRYMGITIYDGVYRFNYREKSLVEFIKEVEKDGYEPKLFKSCVDFFTNLDLDLEDGFEVQVIYIGRMAITNEPVYSINIKNHNGILYNTLFQFDLLEDDNIFDLMEDNNIDILMDSLCKAMYLKSYRDVEIKFTYLWNKQTFNEYYNEFINEVE